MNFSPLIFVSHISKKFPKIDFVYLVFLFSLEANFSIAYT